MWWSKPGAFIKCQAWVSPSLLGLNRGPRIFNLKMGSEQSAKLSQSPNNPSNEESVGTSTRNGRKEDKTPFNAAAMAAAVVVANAKLIRLDDEKIQQRACDAAASALREDNVYGTILNAVRHQRDQYLTGKTYAEAQTQRRGIEDRLKRDLGDEVKIALPVPLDIGRQRDGPSLCEVQLTALGRYYIPSQITIDALSPTVSWLPSRDGPLTQPFNRAVTNLIPMGQSSLDIVMRNNILWILKDQRWRSYVKERTRGLVTGAPNSQSNCDTGSK